MTMETSEAARDTYKRPARGARLDRLAYLSGALMVAMGAVGVLINGAFEYFPSADRAAEFFSTESGRVARGGLIGALSAVFLILFAGTIHRVVSDRDEGSRWLSLVSFGGGLFAALAFAMGNLVIWVAAARAGRPEGIGPEEAIVMYDLSVAILAGVGTYGLLTFIGAAGMASIRTRLLPAWLGWVAVGIAVGLATPLHYIFEGLALIWILVTSIWLYLRAPAPTEGGMT